MWYLIADANGLDESSSLTVGDTLTLPNVVSSTHNDETTFKPYNPAAVIGNTTPSPLPPPPPDEKCNAVATVVMVVVAVAVTVFTAGAAATVMAGGWSALGSASMAGLATAGSTALAGGAVTVGAFSTTAIGSMSAAAIGAMAGSAASQMAGMAMGEVDPFSWSQVAASGLTAGLSAGAIGAAAAGPSGWAKTAATGIQEAASGTKAITDPWQAASVYGAKGVSDYAASQVANRVAGLDTSFSWQGVAAAAASSALGGAVGASDMIRAQQPGAFFRDQFTAHASAAMNDKWFGGTRPDYGQVAADAFGNTLGNWVVGKMATSGTVVPEAQWELKPAELLADSDDANAMSDTLLMYDPYDIDPVPNSILDSLGLNIGELLGRYQFASQDGVNYIELPAIVAKWQIGANEFIAGTVYNGFVESAVGLIGIPTALATDADTAAGFMRYLQDEWRYDLRTEAGRDISYGIGTTLAPVAGVYEGIKTDFGDFGYKLGGPALATAFYTGPDALLSLLAPEMRAAVGSVGLTAKAMVRYGNSHGFTLVDIKSSGLGWSERGSIGIRFGEVVPNQPINISALTPKGIPSFKSGQFNDWFDVRTPEEISALYQNPALRNKIEDGLRGAGGNHEFLMVAEAPQWSQWGVRAGQVQEDFAIPISALNEGGLAKGWTHSTGLKGSKSPGSKTVHNELQNVIKNSSSLSDFKANMQPWAEKWINGGYKALPPGFHQ